MGNMNSLLLGLFIALFSNNGVMSTINDKEANNSSQLVAVAVIFRHGDRAPFTSFPNDRYYNLTYWPMGYGQLTKQGIQRQYKLGQWFRQRYKDFLSDIYSPEDIYVHSTNKNRCLMSATVNLAGLYPPKGQQVWNENLRWQPIPVHVGFESNEMNEPCPKYDALLEEITVLIYDAFEKKYKDTFELISENTGWTDLSMFNVGTLRSVMYAYKHYNESFIPEWMNKVDPEILDHIAGVRYYIATASHTLKRLRVGIFYDFIFNYFDKFANSSLSQLHKTPKFMMMSSHDTTLTSILDGMGLYKMRPVGFGDTFIMELRRNDKKFFVNLFYKSVDKLEELRMNECEFDCNYERLKVLLKNVTIDINTRRAECG